MLPLLLGWPGQPDLRTGLVPRLQLLLTEGLKRQEQARSFAGFSRLHISIAGSEQGLSCVGRWAADVRTGRFTDRVPLTVEPEMAK